MTASISPSIAPSIIGRITNQKIFLVVGPTMVPRLGIEPRMTA